MDNPVETELWAVLNVLSTGSRANTHASPITPGRLWHQQTEPARSVQGAGLVTSSYSLTCCNASMKDEQAEVWGNELG